jgi:hypothetical protein
LKYKTGGIISIPLNNQMPTSKPVKVIDDVIIESPVKQLSNLDDNNPSLQEKKETS